MTDDSPFMRLDSDDIARITGGVWYNLDKTICFTGVRVNPAWVAEGNLCFLTRSDQWGAGIGDTSPQVDRIFAAGATAIVATDPATAANASRPVLLVEDGRKALEALATHARDHFDVTRVLVTGTDGKTGFKNILYQLMARQVAVHANLDSSNLDVPIMCSLASLPDGVDYEIIEASVANPGTGERRSELVQPDLCVITALGLSHVGVHGSFDNLVRNKAGIVAGMEVGGPCLINTDVSGVDQLREAIYRNRYVDIQRFGKGEGDTARLLEAGFDSDRLAWKVRAEIDGVRLDYDVPLIGEHVPVASLAPLLTIHRLGLDVRQAAADYAGVKGYETMGRLVEVREGRKAFRILDHSQRASVMNYRSALSDLGRLKPTGTGRKVAVVGNIPQVGELSEKAHRELAPQIEAAGVQRLYTVGPDCRVIERSLRNRSIMVAHGDTPADVEAAILNDIQDGDLLLVKGPIKLKLKDLVASIQDKGEVHEIR